MDIKIVGEHINITHAIEEYIKKKFSHVPAPEKIIRAEFRLGKDGQFKHHVKFTANLNHKNITINVSDENAYKAIDNLIKKLHIIFTKQKNNYKHLISAQH